MLEVTTLYQLSGKSMPSIGSLKNRLSDSAEMEGIMEGMENRGRVDWQPSSSLSSYVGWDE